MNSINLFRIFLGPPRGDIAWIFAFPPIELAFPPIELAFPPIELAFPPIELAFPPIELAFPPIELAFPPIDSLLLGKQSHHLSTATFPCYKKRAWIHLVEEILSCPYAYGVLLN
ncbi:hypothetical protein ACFSUM_06465 [Virgibacillus siamensis]|uniref:hypothetical protein n=1 Tax=Virgibacillus siamensis TaxID=480071 RepID=UPI0031D2F834